MIPSFEELLDKAAALTQANTEAEAANRTNELLARGVSDFANTLVLKPIGEKKDEFSGYITPKGEIGTFKKPVVSPEGYSLAERLFNRGKFRNPESVPEGAAGLTRKELADVIPKFRISSDKIKAMHDNLMQKLANNTVKPKDLTDAIEVADARLKEITNEALLNPSRKDALEAEREEVMKRKELYQNAYNRIVVIGGGGAGKPPSAATAPTKYSSKEQVKAAMDSGKITRAQAISILRSQFGME